MVCQYCNYDLGECYENCGASEDGICPECCNPHFSEEDMLRRVLPAISKDNVVGGPSLDGETIHYRVKGDYANFHEISTYKFVHLGKQYLTPSHHVVTTTRHQYCDIEIFKSSIGCRGESIYEGCFKDEFTALLIAIFTILLEENESK